MFPRLAVAFTLACMAMPGVGRAEVACELPADASQDAGPPFFITADAQLGLTERVYDQDPTWGDPIDLGRAWIDAAEDSLRVSMQVRSFEIGSHHLEPHFEYRFSWYYPDATHYSRNDNVEWLRARYDAGAWTFSAAGPGGTGSKPVAGAFDAETNTISWTVGIDRGKTGDRLKDVMIQTFSSGIGMPAFPLGAIAQDESPYADPSVNPNSPVIELDLSDC